MSLSDFELQIRLLNPKNTTTHKNISPKILKAGSEATVHVLCSLFNETIRKSVFPDNLKLAEDKPVTYIYIYIYMFSIYIYIFYIIYINYIYCIYNYTYIHNYIENHLSRYLCGYIKSYLTDFGFS